MRSYVAGGSPSLFTLITFIGGEGNPMHGVIFGGIGAVITIGVSAVLSFILFKDPEQAAASAPAAVTVPLLSDGVLVSPIIGSAVALDSIEDQVFSGGTLGQGIAIEPSVGEVHAPCDGVISTFFDTGHALGITADSGAELLIHVGMDTVKLDGKGFTPRSRPATASRRGSCS